MGRERFLFVPFPLPRGSALWGPDLTGRKSWRYSPECVEDEFSEVDPSGRRSGEPRSKAHATLVFFISWSRMLEAREVTEIASKV